MLEGVMSKSEILEYSKLQIMNEHLSTMRRNRAQPAISGSVLISITQLQRPSREEV
jgi:hypothetical protein